MIGVRAETILNWEKNNTEPPVTLMPAVIRFLGYEPWPPPTTLGERMAAYRRQHGLTTNKAALRAGVDEESWAKWERTGSISTERSRLLVESVLGAMAGETEVQSPQL